MQDFDIVLFKTYSWIGRIIRYFINIQYNHAAIYYKGVLFESNAYGVDIRTFPSYSKADEWVILTPIVPLNDEHKQKLLERMLILSSDSRYDFWNFFVLQPIYRIFGKWLGESSTAKAMICSEFVARVHEEFFEEPEMVTPYEILNCKYFKK